MGEIFFGDIDGKRNEIGAFDRVDKRLKWALKLTSGKAYPAIRKIKFSNNQLYVLDGNNVLHNMMKNE